MKKISAQLFVMFVIFFTTILTATAQPAWYEWPSKWFNSISGVQVHEQAPLHLGRTLAGENMTLEDLNSRIVFLSFWAPWCPPCIKELPALTELQNSFKSSEFQIITIAIHTKRDELVSFLKKHPLGLTILLDDDNRVATSYGVLATPTGFFLNASGKILQRWVGMVDAGEVKKEINAYLGKKDEELGSSLK